MTTQQSNFNSRADSAASLLKADLSKRFGKEIPEAKVVVDSNGQPPKPLPPQGSYMRQMIENQRAQQQAERQGQPTPEQVLGDQPQAPPAERAVDGSVVPTDQMSPHVPVEQDLSDRAQSRFSELTQNLKAKEQELQLLMANLENESKTRKSLETRLQDLENQHHAILQSNLESLDPETRLQVMMDAKNREYFANLEERLMGRIAPHIQNLQQTQAQTEMERLSRKYPNFSIGVHVPLIDMFRSKNPHSSIEQAYKAIAEPHELVTNGAALSHAAAPPIAAPGSGQRALKYQPQPQSNPEEEMVADAQRVAKLMRSDNPEDRKVGLRLADKNIADRLRGRNSHVM